MSFCDMWPTMASVLYFTAINFSSTSSARREAVSKTSVQFHKQKTDTWSSLFLQFIMKMYRGINGRTSGSGHELQVHRTSWTRSDVDRRPAGSCRTGSGCPWSPSWRPHPHLQEDEGLMLFYQIFSIRSVKTFSLFLCYVQVFHISYGLVQITH